MNKEIHFSEDRLQFLERLLKQNQEIDFKLFHLQNKEKVLGLNWDDLPGNQDDIIFLLKAYQRLIRILPEQDSSTVIALLRENLHSAIQIASIPKLQFMKRYTKVFDGKKEVAETVYKNALQKRSQLMLQYMNVVQNNEPHIKATRLNG